MKWEEAFFPKTFSVWANHETRFKVLKTALKDVHTYIDHPLNIHQPSIDRPSTIYWTYIIHQPSITRPSIYHQPSIYHSSTVHHPSTIHWPSINHLLNIHRPSIDCPSTIYRPSIDQLSNIHWPTIKHPLTIRTHLDLIHFKGFKGRRKILIYFEFTFLSAYRFSVAQPTLLVSCPLDTIPPRALHEFLLVISPDFSVISQSRSSGWSAGLDHY